MMKSKDSEIAKRINVTISLLRKNSQKEKILETLMKRFGVSKRQAYRYLQKAEKRKHRLSIPEQKEVFTVKLPISLISRVRQLANSTGESLSNIVAQALKLFLKRRGHG